MHSDDVVNAGFVQGETSHVVVQVVYDEVAELDDYDGVDITPLTRELSPKNAFGLNLMRITVDGEPIDDPETKLGRHPALHRRRAEQRRHPVRLRQPRGRAGASPSRREPATVACYRSDEGWAAEPVRFTMYANYAHFIERAEVRIFELEQSLEAEPVGVVVFGPDGSGEWLPEPGLFATPARELKYVLRAYGSGGTFDETVPQPLWIAYRETEPTARPSPPAEPAARRRSTWPS